MKKCILFILLTGFLLLHPNPVFSEVYFSENFESGSSPVFSFDGTNDYKTNSDLAYTGEIVNVGGERNWVWKNTFHYYCNDSYFGHTVSQKSSWNIINKFHWRAYIKFGDQNNNPEWLTATPPSVCSGVVTQKSYELKFPDIGGGDGLDLGRIIGKLRSANLDGQQGVFRLYTPNGQNHDHTAQGAEPFVSNRWYSVEFMVEDNGNNDTVKIWINNNNEASPDYSYTGGDMFDSSQWIDSIRWNHGYRNHTPPDDKSFYYDDFVISNSFIGTGQSNSRPAPPIGLRSLN